MSSKLLLRILRPFLHSIMILVVFGIAYLIRKQTDLIPMVQLRIPIINLIEMSIFAMISIVVFFVVGLVSGLYKLYHPVYNYYRIFLKTIGLWSITITCIAYFGNGFVFHDGISRFILIAVISGSLIMITVLDRLIDIWNDWIQ